MTAADLELHARLGIHQAMLERAGVRRVDDREARDLLTITGSAGCYSGIFYPYFDPTSLQRVTGRLRLDYPPQRPDGKPDGKYRAGYGDNRHLYFPPGSSAFLEDTSVPCVWVESEKAALAIVSAAERSKRSVLVIACGGCWSWRGTIGKGVSVEGRRVDIKGPLSDLCLPRWTGRIVTILFDARPNDSVNAASRGLARELGGRGADVRHAHLPDESGINGPDDYIAVHGDAALWTVLDHASAEEFRRHRKSGNVLAADLHNLRLAIARLGMRLSFDIFARQVLINGACVDDLSVDRIWVQIFDEFGFRADKEALRTLLVVEAHRQLCHPVVVYLEGLRWDGVPRLDHWLVTYGGAADSAYVRAVSALPLLAAVRRVREPGVKFDELLVLESEQGTMKSSALRTLCPDEAWFSDDLPLGADSKHVIERTAGKWLIEASEMHGHKGRAVEQLKAFLSRQVDGPVRLAYGRTPTTVPRQFVMVGTTNATSSYLGDSTGARRFWPVRVVRFDLAALRRDRDQLWAEACVRASAGESLRLAPDLWSAAGEEQEQRRAMDPWEDVLAPVLGQDRTLVTCKEVWETLGVVASARNNRDAGRVAAIMTRAGFIKKKSRLGGLSTHLWMRTGPSSSEE